MHERLEKCLSEAFPHAAPTYSSSLQQLLGAKKASEYFANRFWTLLSKMLKFANESEI
jgi:hypothetical protein